VTIKTVKYKRRLVAEINVVPYIDVMLVLLIVFMVTAPLLMQGVKVELPNAPSAPLDKNDRDPLIVSIKADGTFYLDLGNGKNIQEPLLSIITKVEKVLRQEPKTSVLVWGDANVRYGSVVKLMSDLQNAGAPSVGLVTEPPRKN
jgi:biopolymer transport protein TolR|tara:strand:- start:195 stop:629 length:435 start_codon:yes stop_codon:yes gene_type:complete